MANRFLKSAGIALSVVALACACTTVNPYTREQQTSKAVKGAGIGAAAGAVVGLLTKGDKQGARDAWSKGVESDASPALKQMMQMKMNNLS